LIYLLCLQPLYRFYADHKQAFVANRALLQWMHQQKSSVNPTPVSSSKPATEKDLIQIVSAEAERQGITFDRLQPQGETKIRLWSQDVAFSGLVAWIAAIQEKGLTIDAIAIDQTGSPGVVSFQCTLENRSLTGI